MREHGLSADELEQLRRWGAGLQQDGRSEVAAAGRAIVLLVEEVERLAANAWSDRLYPGRGMIDALPSQAEAASELQRSLRNRLRSVGRRQPENPQPERPS